MVFRLVVAATLLGVPLLTFYLLARENVSGKAPQGKIHKLRVGEEAPLPRLLDVRIIPIDGRAHDDRCADDDVADGQRQPRQPEPGQAEGHQRGEAEGQRGQEQRRHEERVEGAGPPRAAPRDPQRSQRSKDGRRRRRHHGDVEAVARRALELPGPGQCAIPAKGQPIGRKPQRGRRRQRREEDDHRRRDEDDDGRGGQRPDDDAKRQRIEIEAPPLSHERALAGLVRPR